MMKQLMPAVALMSGILMSAALPTHASADGLRPVACPTEDDLYHLLNAVDRHDRYEAARLFGPVCQPLAGTSYRLEDAANGIATIRLFPKEGDWAGSRLAYTLDEMLSNDQVAP